MCWCLADATCLWCRKKNIGLEAKRPGLKYRICHILLSDLGQVTKTFSASDSMSVSGESWYLFYRGFLK